jgi:hypothetical protein
LFFPRFFPDPLLPSLSTSRRHPIWQNNEQKPKQTTPLPQETPLMATTINKITNTMAAQQSAPTHPAASNPTLEDLILDQKVTL